jgi:dolichol-phosphate mannosyltransferase
MTESSYSDAFLAGASAVVDPPRDGSPIELAVIIPTLNERDNVGPLFAALERALAGVAWEAIFVDDNSSDGTSDAVRELGRRDPRARILQRVGRRGLSSACIEGILSTAAPFVAVIDGDLQHDEMMLPQMLELGRTDKFDVVIGSRNIEGGGMGDIAANRVWLSNMGSRISRFVCKCRVSDPMSGFFLVRHDFFLSVVPRLTGTGFKILVDLLASAECPVRVAEVPYYFRARSKGKSKLDINVELEYLFLLVDKFAGRVIPTRFVVFMLVGSLGFIVHMSALTALHFESRATFAVSQAIATALAMTFNFLLNNAVTFRDRRLRGWRMLRGLLVFYGACSLGALINVSFADFLFDRRIPWYLAGICGLAITSVWNYAASVVLTWRGTRPAPPNPQPGPPFGETSNRRQRLEGPR